MQNMPNIPEMSEKEVANIRKLISYWATQLTKKEQEEREKLRLENIKKNEEETKKRLEEQKKKAEALLKSPIVAKIKALKKPLKKRVTVTFSFDLSGNLITGSYGIATRSKVDKVTCSNRTLAPHINNNLRKACNQILDCNPELKGLQKVYNEFYKLSPDDRKIILAEVNKKQ